MDTIDLLWAEPTPINLHQHLATSIVATAASRHFNENGMLMPINVGMENDVVLGKS